MTADVELLPLPEPKFLARRTASGEWLELLDASDWTAEMWEHGTDPVYSADQLRANVAHATAAKDAVIVDCKSTIEALRAEVERWKSASLAQSGYAYAGEKRAAEAEARADRLAEALRGLLDVGDKFTGDPNEDAATWVAANDAARAALNPTAAQGAGTASA